jgi:hypothetical protein
MSIDMIKQSAESLTEVIRNYDILVKRRQISYEEFINNKNKKYKKELIQIDIKLEKIKKYALALMSSMEKQINSRL